MVSHSLVDHLHVPTSEEIGIPPGAISAVCRRQEYAVKAVIWQSKGQTVWLSLNSSSKQNGDTIVSHPSIEDVPVVNTCLQFIAAYYEDRGGDLVDVDNNIVGNCHTDTADSFDCFYGSGGASIGTSQLFCTTGLAIP
jgi:hypothetical protein